MKYKEYSRRPSLKCVSEIVCELLYLRSYLPYEIIYQIADYLIDEVSYPRETTFYKELRPFNEYYYDIEPDAYLIRSKNLRILCSNKWDIIDNYKSAKSRFDLIPLYKRSNPIM